MQVHRLKTWPAYFAAIKSGKKTFEIRKNDRNYRTGDILYLEEYDPETKTYSGDAIAVKVEYMLEAVVEKYFGLEKGYAIMSFSINPPKQATEASNKQAGGHRGEPVVGEMKFKQVFSDCIQSLLADIVRKNIKILELTLENKQLTDQIAAARAALATKTK